MKRSMRARQRHRQRIRGGCLRLGRHANPLSAYGAAWHAAREEARRTEPACWHRRDAQSSKRHSMIRDAVLAEAQQGTSDVYQHAAQKSTVPFFTRCLYGEGASVQAPLAKKVRPLVYAMPIRPHRYSGWLPFSFSPGER